MVFTIAHYFFKTRNFAFTLLNADYYFLSALLMSFVCGVMAFPLTFLSGSNVLIGLALFPFVLFIDGNKKINVVYIVLSVLFGMAAYRYTVKMFYFFALSFFILFLIEAYKGRLNTLVLFVIAFMSPFFHQVVTILGFPIRLKLSAIASSILSSIGLDVYAEGNIMKLDSGGFSIDQACIGLNMLSIGLMMGAAALANQYRTTRLRLTFSKLVLFFLLVLGLNVFSNLLRILILVAFKVLPDNPMHEFIGILCLVGYVMVPTFFLSRWMCTRFGNESEMSIENKKYKTLNVFIILLSALMVLAGIHIHGGKKVERRLMTTYIPGFISEISDNGVMKLHNAEALIYIKPIAEFFTGEHTPLMCWSGSGFHFDHINTRVINNRSLYVGELVNGKQKLFTAWWYTNGLIQTTNQFDWRYRMLKGENKFSLINVTASDACTLYTNVTHVLDMNIVPSSF